ncbi:MAG: hypothetical protein AABX52_02045 [Nanoarchaeota archaeon]
MVFSVIYSVHEPTLLDRIRALIAHKNLTVSKDKLSCLLHPNLVAISDEFDKQLRRLAMQHEEIVLYYPGCGTDLVWPLLVLQAAGSKAMHWIVVCQDIVNCLDEMIASVQMLTGEIVFEKTQLSGLSGVRFHFSNRQLTILFLVADISYIVPSIPCHIYLDRGFEIIRNNIDSFYSRIPLYSRGLFITDAAFATTPKGYSCLHIRLPEWGFYPHPAVYRKD